MTHDMAPKDPYADYSRSQSMYDPSRGAPVRDFRMRGYTSHQMLEEHKRSVLPLGESPSPRAPVQKNEPVTKLVNPGRADTSSEFFQGKHTTAQTRANVFGGIDDRFTPAEVARLEKQRTQQHQDELQRYIEEVKRSKVEAGSSKDHEKRKDLEMLRAYDPWSKPAAEGGKSKALVSKDRQDRQVAEAAGDSYVAQVFGKQGAGAPVRTDSGKVKANYTVDGDTQMSNVYRSNFGVDAGRRYGPRDGANDYKAALDLQSSERARLVAEQSAQERSSVEESPFVRGSQNPPPRVKQPKEDPDRERRAHYAKALEQQQKEHRAKKEQEVHDKSKGDDYVPWGRGVGVPERDASGKLVKKAPANPIPTEPTMVDFLGRPGAGAPISEGSGRLSPNKAAPPAEGSYDPFGKPGAGAPGGEARRTRTITDMQSGSSPTQGSYAARHDFLREQQAHIEAKRQSDKAAVATDRDSPHKPDDFFKFGQGAANPKRDEHGHMSSQHRGQTDIIQMQLDTGGGLGRKQKGETSQALHQQLERQAHEKRQLDAQARQAQIEEEQRHVGNASQWQGKAGEDRKSVV